MDLYASFDEKGYKVEAFIPSGSNEQMQFLVKVYDGSKVIKELKIPMDHEPIFGVDVDDNQRLEDETEKLMQSLPDKSNNPSAD